MSGYTDTILIDCNRSNSAEKNDPSSDSSVFTCPTGDGLRLNVGDTVSVHSGFVSEVGCGAGVIEMTGKDLQTDTPIEYTAQIKKQLFWSPFLNGGGTTADPPYGDMPPWNAHYVGYEQRSKIYRLKDNEINMSVTFYKTTNGEGYFNLPRRFSADFAAYDWNDHAPQTTANQQWVAEVMPPTKNGPEDCYNQGRTMAICQHQECINPDDTYYQKHAQAPVATTVRTSTPVATTSKLWKKKNDNSRMTLFVLKDNYYGWRTTRGMKSPNVRYKDLVLAGDDINWEQYSENRDTFKTNATAFQPRDPAYMEWIPYKEIKTIDLEKGFQAPNSMAEELTNQLQERGDTQTVFGVAGGTLPPGVHSTTGSEQSRVTTYSDSECYKTFATASAWSFSKNNYETYWKSLTDPYVASSQVDGSADPNITDFNDGTQQVVDYISSYSTIGIKRPALWIAGREVVKSCSSWNNGIYDPGPPGNWYPIGDLYAEPPGVSWREFSNAYMVDRISWTDRKSTNHDANLIVTSIAWNDINLLLLKNWFDEQGKDESLFNQYNHSNLPSFASIDTGNNELSSSNARFIHMNTDDYIGGVGALEYNQLGSDNYENVMGTAPTGVAFQIRNSAPLFISYDPERADMGPEIDGGGTPSNMVYGFAIKRKRDLSDGADVAERECICFDTSLLGGIPNHFWNFATEAAPPTADTDAYYLSGNKWGGVLHTLPDPNPGPDPEVLFTRPRMLGYDTHFTAYGTNACCLYAGFLNGEANDRTRFTDIGSVSYDTGAGKSQLTQQAQYVMRRYVGASAPEVTFDAISSKFNLTSLHTPEYTGNTFDAGSGPDETINPDAGDPVWYLNKRVRRTEFCPDMMPYRIDHTVTVGATKIAVSPMNWSLTPWKIFDADGGIFIDNFNIAEADWDKSLMGIMGFSYGQFHGANSGETRQTRINDNIIFDPAGSLTTNAVVNGGDLIQFRTNQFGANYYTGQLPIGMDDDAAGQDEKYIPVVSEKADSASIEAQFLPRKMLSPYFIIRSDIITDAKYTTGEGENLPIVYVVNKENGFGDFFFQNTTETTFTITKSRMLTDITTSIHNPDMSLATTTEGSGIIYKINKINNADLNVADEVLNKNKKK